jgi:hypothetical protein
MSHGRLFSLRKPHLKDGWLRMQRLVEVVGRRCWGFTEILIWRGSRGQVPPVQLIVSLLSQISWYSMLTTIPMWEPEVGVEPSCVMLYPDHWSFPFTGKMVEYWLWTRAKCFSLPSNWLQRMGSTSPPASVEAQNVSPTLRLTWESRAMWLCHVSTKHSFDFSALSRRSRQFFSPK